MFCWPFLLIFISVSVDDFTVLTVVAAVPVVVVVVACCCHYDGLRFQHGAVRIVVCWVVVVVVVVVRSACLCVCAYSVHNEMCRMSCMTVPRGA